jgi:hypothetical protein
MKKETLIQFIALFLLEMIIFYPANYVHALSVSNITVADIKSNSARVKWETDEVANGRVRFGSTQGLGFTSRHNTFIFDHDQQLLGLDSDKEYFFKVESTNLNGNEVVDDNNGNFYSFHTKDITPPQKVSGVKINSVTKDSVSISWQQSQETDISHYNIYRDRILTANTTSRSFSDTGLNPGTIHSYRISAADISGNEGLQSDTIIVKTEVLDVSSPTISNLYVSDITNTGARMAWLTNENTTSLVYYGANDSFAFKQENSVLTKNHSIVLTGLIKETVYSFIASSCDKDNNCANSSISEFTAGFDIIPPNITASVPRFFNKNFMDIIGTTEPFSSMQLFVNDLNVPARILDSSEVPKGEFEFPNVQLQKENVIKLLATDKAKNRAEKTFRVTVDTEDPIVVLDHIPSITKRKNITIIGTVDEPVVINFFLNFGSESQPDKISGLRASVLNNSVTLEWNQSKSEGFSHYIVYREDAGPIAITQPASYNTFTDLLVNKGKKYAYFVSAVSEFGKESEPSDTMTAEITRGVTGIPRPEPIDTVIIEKPELVSNASGSFSESLKITKEGLYTLVMEFVDRAKNRVLIEKSITLDTKEPDIKILSPPSGTLIFENYANEVDIKGTTEPNSRIHLFIERTPLGFLDKNVDISGIPNKIESLPESKLEADCSLKIGGTSFCKESADFSTTADSSGNFEFENVDLTSFLSGGLSISQVSGTELRDRSEFEDARDAKLVFIATDAVGLRAAKEHRIRIGTCWAGNQSWEVLPLPEFQTPALLSPQRLAENREIIQFFMNYTYIGRGRVGKDLGEIEHVSVRRACQGTELLGDKRFNISCQIMPGSGFTDLNDEGTISFTNIDLHRIEGMDRFLRNDWEDFFDSISNELTFPLKFIITYEHTVDGKKVKEVQTTCQEVTYVVDNSKIDPRAILPDWLLFDAVDIIQDTIITLNELNEKINKVVDFVAVGCSASFVGRIATQIYRRFVSFSSEKLSLLSVGTIGFTGDQQTQDYCNQVSKNVILAHKSGITSLDALLNEKTFKDALKDIKLKHYSDADLQKCFPTVAKAWEAEEFMYRSFRFTCDRIFGHTTPSRWTENLEDKKLSDKVVEGSVCGVDDAVKAQTLVAVKCRDIASEILLKEDVFGLEDICFRAQLSERERTFYRLLDREEGSDNIYRLATYRDGSLIQGTKYAQKVSETKYLTNQPQTCAQVCGIDKSREGTATVTKSLSNDAKKTKFSSTTNTKVEGQWQCTTTSICKSLREEVPTDLQKGRSKEAVPETTQLGGYTDDCFYKAGEVYRDDLSDELKQKLRNDNVLSGNTKERYECCCIDVTEEPRTDYYQWNDINRYLPPPEGKNCAFQSKRNPEECAGFDSDQNVPNFDDMKWSYRYWKEGYVTQEKLKPDTGSKDSMKQHFKYNPLRYTEGRDFPACFGFNNVFYDSSVTGGEKGNLLTIDPQRDLTSTFQCANIVGISNRITEFNNILSALAACLIDVRETGTSDAAVCRDLATQYVCSAVSDVINYLTNSCSPFSSIVNTDSDFYDDVFGGGVNLVKSVSESITDAQSEVSSEYGNAQLNNLLGAGQGGIARKICLGAFGHDWDLNLQNVIDAAYAQSFDTLVQAPTATREYLTVDPKTAQARYDYRASWFINPGCDIESYNVKLVCVNRDEKDKNPDIRCDKIGSPDGSNCDCLNAQTGEGARSQSFFSKNRLKQNEFVQDGESKIVSSLYRYDHLKFEFRADRELIGPLKKTCFPPGHDDGIFYFPITDRTPKDLAACQIDATSGVLKCRSGLDFFNQKGLAQLIEVKVNGKEVENNRITVFKGEDLTITPTILKSAGSPLKCLLIELDRKVGVKDTRYYEVNVDGPNTYNPIILQKNMQPARRETKKFEQQAVSCKKADGSSCDETISKMSLNLEIDQNNKFDKTLRLKFIDNDDSKKIELGPDSKDTIQVDGVSQNIRDMKREGSNPVVDIPGNDISFRIRNADITGDGKEIEYLLRFYRIGGDETWDLTLSLRDVAEGAKTCNAYERDEILKYNNVEQVKSIRLNLRTSPEAIVAPKIRIDYNDNKNSLNPRIDDFMILNIELNDNQAPSRPIFMLMRPSEGFFSNLVTKVKEEFEFDVGESEKLTCQDPVKTGDDYKKTCQLIVDYNLLGIDPNHNIGGLYTLKVIAHDTESGDQSEQDISVQVRCGQYDSTSAGLCKSRSTCNSISITIGEGEGITCPKDLICCQDASIS